jgi:hypothetical protein
MSAGQMNDAMNGSAMEWYRVAAAGSETAAELDWHADKRFQPAASVLPKFDLTLPKQSIRLNQRQQSE